MLFASWTVQKEEEEKEAEETEPRIEDNLRVPKLSDFKPVEDH